MSRLFKALAALVAITCFVWVAVLWQWQRTQRDMSVQDIGLYLVALPVTLFVLVLLGRWAWAGASEQARGREEAARAAAAAPPAAAAPSADEADRRASIRVLTAQLNCAAGNTPAAVLAAVAEGQPRPSIDAELRDDEGLPVMAARIAKLDVDALDLEPLQAAVRARQPGGSDTQASPEALRALAALAPPLDAALMALEPWRAAFGLQDQPPQRVSQSMLRVLAAWPAEFTPFEAALANAWLAARIDAAALAAPARVAPLPLPPGDGVAAWLAAEKLLRTLEREQRRDVVLLVAAHSAIGAASVRRLQASQRLYTARSAHMPMVGEAAAALVLAPPSWPLADAPGSEDAAPVWLHRAATARRDKAIDAPGRSGNQWAASCIDGALAGGPFAPEAAAAAVHDADQHTNRAAEALTALLAKLPHLTPADDVAQTGALNGQAGVAAPLIVAALAAERAAQLGQPCLALCVDDAHQRLALLARPATVDPASAPAPAA